jgi:hypothetical protein
MLDCTEDTAPVTFIFCRDGGRAELFTLADEHPWECRLMAGHHPKVLQAILQEATEICVSQS